MTSSDHDVLARALFSIAKERSDPSRIADELDEIGNALASVPLLARTLSDPGLPAQEKHAIVTDVFGKTLSSVSLGLLDFLIDENGAAETSAVARAYRKLLDEERGVVRARVTSAFPLSPEHADALKEGLSRNLGANVVIEHEVDPEILAGLLVRVHDTVIDASLAGKLRRLAEELEAPGRDAEPTTPPGE